VDGAVLTVRPMCALGKLALILFKLADTRGGKPSNCVYRHSLKHQ